MTTQKDYTMKYRSILLRLNAFGTLLV